MYAILVYDICKDENGQKAWSKVFKICKKYFHHIQNSVFGGEITEAKLLKLKNELKRYIREDKDSVILFKTRQEKWIDKEFLGIKDDKTSQFL